MRFVVAAICTFLGMSALVFVIFGPVLAPWFGPVTALFRPPEQLAQTAIWTHVAQLTRAVIFGGMILILNGQRKLGLVKGAWFGALAGLFIGTFHVVSAASFPLPPSTAIAWVTFDTLLLTFGGLLFSLTYHPKKS